VRASAGAATLERRGGSVRGGRLTTAAIRSTIQRLGGPDFLLTVAHVAAFAPKGDSDQRPSVRFFRLRIIVMSERKFRFLDPESPRRAPDYGSRPMQRKLFALVACLFAILWCMQQAARPETWQWLVHLDEAAKARRFAEDGEDGELGSSAKPSPPPEVTAGTDNPRLSQSRPLPVPSAASATGNYDPHVPPVELPWTIEAAYWRLALTRLSPEQQFALVHAFHTWCTELETAPELDPVLHSALTKMQNLRIQFDREIMSRAATDTIGGTSPSGSAQAESSDQAGATPPPRVGEETTVDQQESDELPDLRIQPKIPQVFQLPVAVGLAEAQALTDHSRWLLTAWGRVTADGDPPPLDRTETQRVSQAVTCRNHWQRLRDQFLEPVLWAAVTDGSRLGRPSERAAWLRLVQKSSAGPAAANETPAASPPIVTRQNLMGQPATFRGQHVRLTGTIRRVELVSQRDPVIAQYSAQPNYAVLWLQPGVSGQGPYCVYTLATPALMALADQSDDVRHPATVDGWFFKLHPYLAANGQPATCPLLLAQQVELRPTSPSVPPLILTPGQWLMVIGTVSLMAAGLAAGAWYSTRYRSANPLGSRKRQAAEVQWLQTAGVSTPGEALREFAHRVIDDDPRSTGEESTDSGKAATPSPRKSDDV